ncbi:MAG TPA: acetylglutamate kinase, partial [Rubricoccaceae bacterium]
MLLVLLGPYHLGDPLFVSALARDLAARKEGLVLVHGSGEAGERALESRGVFPEAKGGVWQTASDDERADVERSARDLNRRLVHELTEAGVPAVRVMAADRGLLASGDEG